MTSPWSPYVFAWHRNTTNNWPTTNHNGWANDQCEFSMILLIKYSKIWYDFSCECFHIFRKIQSLLIKSTCSTGVTMFFYWFVSRRQPQIFFMLLLLIKFLDFFHFWMDWWAWPTDYLIRFWSTFVLTLTLNFQGQIWNLLYLSQIWSDCHKTKTNILIEL